MSDPDLALFDTSAVTEAPLPVPPVSYRATMLGVPVTIELTGLVAAHPKRDRFIAYTRGEELDPPLDPVDFLDAIITDRMCAHLKRVGIVVAPAALATTAIPMDVVDDVIEAVRPRYPKRFVGG